MAAFKLRKGKGKGKAWLFATVTTIAPREEDLSYLSPSTTNYGHWGALVTHEIT